MEVLRKKGVEKFNVVWRTEGIEMLAIKILSVVTRFGSFPQEIYNLSREKKMINIYIVIEDETA